jgi:hypothetical protein
VDILVGLSRPEVQALRAALRPIPQPVQLRALIDTGAEATCLDRAIITRAALPWLSPTQANMPGGPGLLWSSIYRAGVTILHPSGRPRQHHVTPYVLVCELPLGLLGYDAVIGRDILATLRFTYDGPAGTFTLDY